MRYIPSLKPDSNAINVGLFVTQSCCMAWNQEHETKFIVLRAILV